jgi:hypothetical protein
MLTSPTIAAQVVPTTGNNQSVAIRGFGNVDAHLSPTGGTFRCDSVVHADTLMGKLAADMLWDAGAAKRTSSVRVAGRDVPVTSWDDYGAVAMARGGNVVTVRSAASIELLTALLAADEAIKSAGAVFTPSRAYPRYLDYYDLRAFKSYTHAMSALPETGLASHWPFMKEFGLAGVVLPSVGFEFHNPAPNVFDWATMDYEVRAAEREGGVFAPAFVTGGPMPLWAYNEAPTQRMEPSPTSLLGSWGVHAGTAGGSYESWGRSPQARERTNFAFMREVVKRYGGSPALGAWMPYTGSPGAEMNFHGRTDEYWDYSATGQQGFRDYLRTVKKYTLGDMAQRWYGDRTRLTSWEQVTIPDVHQFFGKLDATCMRLNDNWQWTPAKVGVAEPPAKDSAAWVPVALPPSQQQAYMPYGPSFYRVSFDPSGWLASRRAAEHYLILALDVMSQQGTQVWLNGDYLGDFKTRAGAYGPIGLKLTGKLKDGINDLAIRVPGGADSEGKIIGPVFLTTSQPRYFPYLGKEQNAQYVDVKDWQAYGMAKQTDDNFRELRALDPNAPMIVSGGALGELGDYASEMASRYNLGVEMTGREAYYYPWNSGLGLVSGFYSTSEPSATALGTSLDRMFGWIMFDGDASHSLYYRLDDYIKRERETGWFTKHKQLIRLFGKALREQPQIVVLRSVETSRLGDLSGNDWDIGRGELQSAHYDNAYATEREMAKGLVSGYPVVFDSGSVILDPANVEAIRKYVEGGGTFIALHNTGRHTTTVPDCWPISSLTGFQVVASDALGTVKFDDKLPVLRGLAGKSYVGTGRAVNYLSYDSGKGAGLKLKEAMPGAVALAHWEDGSVAVGYRKIGKGQVIVLGSSFWRDGKDLSGVWRSDSEIERDILGQLFTSLGVQRTSSSDRTAVWTRNFVTKNGLQEWALAFNSLDVPTTCDVSWYLATKPAEVIDMATNVPVPFTYANGWVHVPQTTIDGYQVRVFGTKRAGLGAGLDVWWGEKLKYWQVQPDSSRPDPVPATRESGETIPMDTWRFKADQDGAICASDAWMSASYPDTSWSKVGQGAWNELHANLANYHGTGLYRAEFVVPNSWSGRRIQLNLYSFDRPIAYDRAKFYINGKLAAKYAKRFWSQTCNFDVTSLVQPGKNTIAVQVDGGDEFSGLCGAVWFSPQRVLDSVTDIGGAWDVYGADFKVSKSVTLPGRTNGRYLQRSIDIPASWRGKSVYLRFKTAEQWMATIVINGRPIAYNQYMHPFGTMTDVNLTPYVKYGTANRLELWPHYTASVPAESHSTVPLQVDEIVVGTASQ